MHPKKFDLLIQNKVSSVRLSSSWLREKICDMLKALKYQGAALSVLLVGDSEIRALNRKYLGHDWVTDVIAFGYQEKKKLRRGEFLFGDVIISIPVAKRNAKLYGNTFLYELCFYICHGLLHLSGHEDKTDKQRLAMHRKQAKILKQIGIEN